MATLKITGVDDQVIQFVSERARLLHFKGQAEYLRNLIREDMLRAERDRQSRIVEILAPLHLYAEEHHITEEQIDLASDKAREAVANRKRNQRAVG